MAKLAFEVGWAWVQISVLPLNLSDFGRMLSCQSPPSAGKTTSMTNGSHAEEVAHLKILHCGGLEENDLQKEWQY